MSHLRSHHVATVLFILSGCAGGLPVGTADNWPAANLITASMPNVPLTVGEAKDLAQLVRGPAGQAWAQPLAWHSNNESVVTVSATSGMAHGIASGKATLTATAPSDRSISVEFDVYVRTAQEAGGAALPINTATETVARPSSPPTPRPASSPSATPTPSPVPSPTKLTSGWIFTIPSQLSADHVVHAATGEGGRLSFAAVYLVTEGSGRTRTRKEEPQNPPDIDDYHPVSDDEHAKDYYEGSWTAESVTFTIRSNRIGSHPGTYFGCRSWSTRVSLKLANGASGYSLDGQAEAGGAAQYTNLVAGATCFDLRGAEPLALTLPSSWGAVAMRTVSYWTVPPGSP